MVGVLAEYLQYITSSQAIISALVNRWRCDDQLIVSRQHWLGWFSTLVYCHGFSLCILYHLCLPAILVQQFHSCDVITFIHSFPHSTKHRHHSPEWMTLSHISFFIQVEVVGFQVLLDSLHTRSMRASWWSPPVLQGESRHNS